MLFNATSSVDTSGTLDSNSALILDKDITLRHLPDLNTGDIAFDSKAMLLVTITISGSCYRKSYKEIKEKYIYIESIVQSLSFPIKTTVKRKLTESVFYDVIINVILTVFMEPLLYPI